MKDELDLVAAAVKGAAAGGLLLGGAAVLLTGAVMVADHVATRVRGRYGLNAGAVVFATLLSLAVGLLVGAVLGVMLPSTSGGAP